MEEQQDDSDASEEEETPEWEREDCPLANKYLEQKGDETKEQETSREEEQDLLLDI